MGLVSKKRAADGLSHLSFTTVAQLSSDKGPACIPSLDQKPPQSHPPTPSLPPHRPVQASTTPSIPFHHHLGQRPRLVVWSLS